MTEQRYEEIRLDQLKDTIAKCYEIIRMDNEEYRKGVNERAGAEVLSKEYVTYAKYGALQYYIEYMKLVAFTEYGKEEE